MRSTTSTLQKDQRIKCSICFNSDKETTIILKNLLNSIVKTKKSKKQEVRCISETTYMEKYEGYLCKLLKFLLQQKIYDINSQECKHQLIYGFLSDKSGYSKRQLDILSENIYQFQVKRNFQLQILNSQIKCFSKTIIESIDSSIHIQKNSSQISQNSIFQKDKILTANIKQEVEPNQSQINGYYIPIIYHPYPQNLIINYLGSSFSI